MILDTSFGPGCVGHSRVYLSSRSYEVFSKRASVVLSQHLCLNVRMRDAFFEFHHLGLVVIKPADAAILGILVQILHFGSRSAKGALFHLIRPAKTAFVD